MKRILYITSAIFLNAVTFDANAASSSAAAAAAAERDTGSFRSPLRPSARTNHGFFTPGEPSAVKGYSGFVGASETPDWGSPVSAAVDPWALGSPEGRESLDARRIAEALVAASSSGRFDFRSSVLAAADAASVDMGDDFSEAKPRAFEGLSCPGSFLGAEGEEWASTLSGGSARVSGSVSPVSAMVVARLDIFAVLEELAAERMTLRRFADILGDPEAIGNEQLSDYYTPDGRLAITVALYDPRISAEAVATMIDSYPVIAQRIDGYEALITSTQVASYDRRSLVEKRIINAAIRRANR